MRSNLTFLKIFLIFLFSVQTWALSFTSFKISELFEDYYSEKESAKTIETLSDYSEKIRDYAPDFHKDLIEDLNANTPLYGIQLTNLHKMLSVYLDIQKRLLDFSNSPSSEAQLKARSGLMAYYNFHQVYFPYYQHNRLRHYLNDEDASFHIKRQELYEALMNLMSWEQRAKIKKSLKKAIGFTDHPVYPFFNKEELISELITLYGDFYRSDLRNDFIVDLTNDLSKWFGNTVGAVRWRKGHLYHDRALNSEIAAILKPLDIITEKTYFALTDKLIPGHFGHNALWLGTKDELIEMGMWNHPSLIPYHGQIEQGKTILEVDRTGTHLKDLRDFMNVDEFAIMRLTRKAYRSMDIDLVFKVAMSQMGKIYDFNFDVETTDRLVCSELLYQTFGSINWPTERLLKRVTISPDNVASLALYTDSPTKLIYYVAEKNSGQRRYKSIFDLGKDIGVQEHGGKFFKDGKELVYRPHQDLPADFPL